MMTQSSLLMTNVLVLCDAKYGADVQHFLVAQTNSDLNGAIYCNVALLHVFFDFADNSANKL